MSAFETLFGRTYNSVGNSNADFIIKTRGQVKVQWGKKFIDIIKDGKLNVDVTLVKGVDNIDNITSDGIYLLEGSNTIVVRINGITVPLVSDNSDNYVSFVREQSTTDEQKKVAQSNIGIRYSTLQEAITKGAYNGVMFIGSEDKLYVAKDGTYTEYTSDVPNPYNKQILIKKTIKRENEAAGALVISGSGSDNSVIVGSQLQGLQVYKEASDVKIVSIGSSLNIYVDDTLMAKYDSTGVIYELPITANDSVISTMLQSPNANVLSGYRLYYDKSSGQSTLEVDNLVTRNASSYVTTTYSELLESARAGKLITSQSYLISDFQNEWELTSEDELVLSDKYLTDDKGNEILDSDGNPIIETHKNVMPIIVMAETSRTVIGKCLAEDNRLLIGYDIDYNQAIGDLTAKGRITKLTDEKGNSCNYDFKHLRFKVTEDGEEKWVYTFRDGENDLSLSDTCVSNVLTVNDYEIKSETITVRDGNVVTLSGSLTNNNFGTINSNMTINGTFNKFTVDGVLENVTFKNLSSINKVSTLSLTNVVFNGDVSNTIFHSDISDVDFDETTYELLYDATKVKDVYFNNDVVSVICIPDIPTSSSALSKGMIMMFDGNSDIPTGWAVCDGTNGTPDLTGNFIKAAVTAGETGTFIPAAEGTSTEEPISYYSLVFIMKVD